jgi:putative transposase
MQVCSRAVVVAIGINALGYREVLGIAVGDSEAESFWRQFLGSLKERGLTGTRLVISDAHLGLTAQRSSGCFRAAPGVAPRGALH